MIDNQDNVENTCLVRGVNYEMINSTALSEIFTTIESNNMDIILLEKVPKITVYSPPGKQHWDDAATSH